jgi:hypothetical protein
MKKVLVMVGILCCLFFTLSSCGSGDTTSPSDTEESTGAGADQATEDAGSMMDQAKEKADEAADSAKELSDKAKDAAKDLTE